MHGTNGHVSWGSTVNPTDVTDVYQEQLTIAGGVPVATTYKGNLEPTQIIPETFRANQPGNGTPDDVVVVPPAAGVPPATVVVPRRNNGPLISVTGTTGLSVQFTGFSPTREVDFFRLLSRADTVAEAIDAQRYFDFGAQNWMYVDDRGNIGYKTSGEIPLREDLQAGTVAGLPPYFIRNGTGGNEWIADPTPAEDQASPYEILPFAEMDGLVNPKRGWISNANQDPNGQTFDNDPLNELRPGGGIRYITPGSLGRQSQRAGHEAHAGDARGRRRLVLGDDSRSRRIRSSTTPRCSRRTSRPPCARPRRRAHRRRSPRSGPTRRCRRRSPASRPGSSRRRPASRRAIDADRSVRAPAAADPGGDRRQRRHDDLQPLARSRAGGDRRRPAPGPRPRQLPAGRRSGDDARSGTCSRRAAPGPPGIVFFAGPVGRDTAVLRALKSALDLAASPAFAPAFGGSTNLADYRWGKLHRIVFRHPLGGPFSIPTGAGFTDLGAGLPGIATDGGFSAVDASSHNPRASTLNGFMFGSGPARRFVAEARHTHPKAVQVIPGGESGNPAGPWFGNQLGLWLTNDYHEATTRRGEIDVGCD